MANNIKIHHPPWRIFLKFFNWIQLNLLRKTFDEQNSDYFSNESSYKAWSKARSENWWIIITLRQNNLKKIKFFSIFQNVDEKISDIQYKHTIKSTGNVCLFLVWNKGILFFTSDHHSSLSFMTSCDGNLYIPFWKNAFSLEAKNLN